jgi:hypothetical protein
MPYHIIKVTEYLKVFKGQDELLFVCEWLPRLIPDWTDYLDFTKNCLSPTWEHLPGISDIPIYRLSGHSWIWKALQDIHDLIRRVQEENKAIQAKAGISQVDRMTLGAKQSLSTGTLVVFLKRVVPLFSSIRMRRSLSTHALDFTVEDMRKQNVRRFTIENDVLKKRMLSVSIRRHGRRAQPVGYRGLFPVLLQTGGRSKIFSSRLSIVWTAEALRSPTLSG